MELSTFPIGFSAPINSTLVADYGASTSIGNKPTGFNASVRPQVPMRCSPATSPWPVVAVARTMHRTSRGQDRFLSDAALTELAHRGQDEAWTVDTLNNMKPADRLWCLVALRRNGLQDDRWVRAYFDDPSEEIQFEMLRWIADGVLSQFIEPVEEKLARPEISYRIFEAALATRGMLRGEGSAGVTDVKLMKERLESPSVTDRVKSYLLRLSPEKMKLSESVWLSLVDSRDEDLAMEAVRTLAMHAEPTNYSRLVRIASDSKRLPDLRAEAIAGLASSTLSEHLELFMRWAEDESPAVRNEALRGLRSKSLDGSHRQKLESIATRFPDASHLVEAIMSHDKLVTGRPPLSDTAAWLETSRSSPRKG